MDEYYKEICKRCQNLSIFDDSIIQLDNSISNLFNILREINNKGFLKKYNKILYDLEYEIHRLCAEWNRIIGYIKRKEEIK